MVQLIKNEFKNLLEINKLLFEDKDKFIHCDIPTLGKVTYYPKANKIQISATNTWKENGFEFVKKILNSIEMKEPLIYENTSLVKIKEVKSNEELRDDFAKNALIGILSNNAYNELMSGNNGLPVLSEVVRLSYEYADEFMIHRSFNN